MAAVNTEEGFDFAAFAGYVKSALPGYQRPLFVRLLGGEMQTTGTFKHQKVRYRNEAFDPGRCDDPLYYFDGESYQPIDAAVFDAIRKGEIRVG
jgi:citronellyl-CoA synthetase